MTPTARQESARDATTRDVQFSVIVPAFDCAATLMGALGSLCASEYQRDAWELIVVDDASRDATAAVAARFADHVVTVSPGPRGPAFARNRGAEAARGSYLVFVDADVCVAPDALGAFATAFAQRPGLAAVFGAYDAHPSERGMISQYRNLLHHHVHTTSAGPAETFWAGCGAIDREVFMRVGKFDERRYTTPEIEDIELGYRLRDAGYQIWLDPAIQGRHLKRWTFAQMIATDFSARAVPWSLLLLERRRRSPRTLRRDAVLNVRPAERAYAALVLIALTASVTACVRVDWRWLIVALVALAPALVGNVPLLRWFARARGWWFALRVIPLRLVFYLISVAGAAWAVLKHWYGPSRDSAPAFSVLREERP